MTASFLLSAAVTAFQPPLICLSRHATTREYSIRAPYATMVDVSTTNEMVGAVGVLLLGAAGYSLILNADDNSADDLTRRGLRDTLENPNTQRTPPPKPLGPLTECITPEGTALLPLVAEEGEEFTDRWLELVQSAVSQSAVVPTADAEISLQARMEEVRTRAKQRLVLSDALATAVERSFFEQSTMRLLTLEGIAPGATLPYDACTLVKASQFFPGQSARQMRAFVVGSAPSDDPTINGRFDRLQAARLYVGAIQFGYFISTVFRMPVEAGLTDEQTLNPQEAAALTGRIKEATRKMRSEAAWAVASRRAGLLFGLDPEAGADDEVMEKVEGAFDDSSRGYEQLRAFTSQVQVVSAGQQEEFFASDGSRLDRRMRVVVRRRRRRWWRARRAVAVVRRSSCRRPSLCHSTRWDCNHCWRRAASLAGTCGGGERYEGSAGISWR